MAFIEINIPSEITLNLNINWNPVIDLTVRHVDPPLHAPGPITLKYIEENMADQIRVQVNSTADSDTETREVKYTVDGGPETVLTYPVAVPESFLVPQGSALHVDVTDTDDGGNASPTTSGDFTVSDTFPPAAPGEVSLTAIGEE